MKRTRATAIALVNWRGVFYERYLLDPHVTALEGANGAGKTTVLIAAYVVLLPDMSRLRFTSVGEHGGTGGDRGLWGRLGEPGRPSYAALDLRLPTGERFLAGVHLERRGEPTVEPTPFVITDLADDVALQDILLERGDVDAIPELPQLREQVARLGARIQTFTTAKEYFGTLFDRGVTPIRLGTEEDRSKLNEMLRTSMTGGISRALTNELRDFLLKEETSLADTLKRMRANLEACRRTRVEVEESRRLEQEISAVYEAGQAMFAAAIHATRERAEELERRVDAARAAVREAEARHDELKQQVADAGLERERLKERLGEMHTVLETDRILLGRLKRAQGILRRISDRESSFAEASRELEQARQARGDADRERDAARRERDVASTRRDKAAEGLADFQRGLEELNRRATEHRLAAEQLEEARRLLPGIEVNAAVVVTLRSKVDGDLRAVEDEVVRIQQAISTAEIRRQEHQEVFRALHALVEPPVEVDDAFERGRDALRRLRELDAMAKEREGLPAQIEDARKLAVRQQRAKERAAKLETAAHRLPSQGSVEDALREMDAALHALEQRHRDDEQAAADAGRILTATQANMRELETAVRRWREALDRVRSLEGQSETSLRSRDDVLALRANFTCQRDEEREALARFTKERDALLEEATRLEQMGGAFPADLLKARDAVEGELLAGQFEEIDVEEAAPVQALLGPLADAIVVEAPSSAADVLVKLTGRPESVWLVGGDASLEINEAGRPPGEILSGNALVVSTNGGWRVTRLPRQPTLGRRARERRVVALRTEAITVASEVDSQRTSLRRIELSLEITDQLLPEIDVLERGDPSPELGETRRRADQAAITERQLRDSCKLIKGDIDALRPRQRGLRDLLPDAWLLDEVDHSARIGCLLVRLDEAKSAARQVELADPYRKIMDAKLDALRSVPTSDADVARMKDRMNDLARSQERLTRATLALRYVDEHRIAVEWTDAEKALSRKTKLAPALQEQLERAKVAVVSAEARVSTAEETLETASSRVNAADAKTKSLTEALGRDREELDELGVDDASDSAVSALQERIRGLESDERDLRQKDEASLKELAKLEERFSEAGKQFDARGRELDSEERSWRPEKERWQRLESTAEERGVLAATLTQRFVQLFSGQGSANLRGKAREHVAELKERLSHARDSDEVQATVEGLLGPQELSGEVYLQAWLAVRDWLRRRIPAQIAEVDEPLEALGRLRDHLAALEVRLARQELDLRGESEDVARNIDIHIRRAQRQVNRLNQDLNHVRFGSIHGVRLRLERVEKMEQILRALREGQAQGLLFQPDMPIEDALEELFRRYGGGRAGGQRLLDYREYLDPRVEVKRQAGTEWEAVNPNRLSTGEGIGIGAALMMVVLTAWERDANLLRPKRSHGTLRLLFLDEANRLDKDNLGVLFDLCENLDLQLLLAAPEVARAEGNTTYRLVRRVGEEGNEEVIVTGRRIVAEASS